MPELDSRAALHQATGCRPLPEPDRVVERAADAVERTGRLDVGTCIQQRVENGDIVAARRPMQWRLCVRTFVAGVDVGAGLDQHGERRRSIREVPALVIGRHVQQRQGMPTSADDPHAREIGVLADQTRQPLQIAGTDGVSEGRRGELGAGTGGMATPSRVDRSAVACREPV